MVDRHSPGATDPDGVAERSLDEAVRQGSRLAIVGSVVSAILAVVKVGAGVLGNSYALIADGVESMFDVVGGIMVWGGLRVSGAPPSEAFPYGRGKAENLAALAVASMLLTGGVGIAIGAFREVLVPHEAPAAFTLPVLIAVVLGKELMFRVLHARGRALGSQALETDAWHHRSDALTSVAAVAGISIALLGGEGYESADDWAALIACAVILWNGARLMRSSVRAVLDEAAPSEVRDEVRRVAAGVAGVLGLDEVRVRRSGLAFLVDIHVEVDGEASVKEGHRIAHAVKDALLGCEAFRILDVLVHIEPASEG